MPRPELRSRATLPYLLYYPTVRAAGTPLSALERRAAHSYQDYLAAEFSGSTSQAVAVVYQPPACLRVLDPVDGNMTPSWERCARRRCSANPRWSSPARPASAPQGHLFGPEPAHGWCYYFEQADLARQQGDWQPDGRTGRPGPEAGGLPQRPAERIPFIEGYAHLGNWPRAQELSLQAAAITPVMQPVLCRLWQRIGRHPGIRPAFRRGPKSVKWLGK